MSAEKTIYQPKTNNYSFTQIKEIDKFFLIPLIISFTTSFSLITILAFYYQLLPPKLPLFYSLAWGETQLVLKQQFLILPAILMLISLINTILAWQLHQSQFVLKRVLMLTLVGISIILFTTGIKIITIFI